MTVPADVIDLVDEATARLVAGLTAVATDGDARAPSALPGWSRGHVLAHLARNADALRGLAEGAARDELATQYPGGAAQRDGDIEAGSGRPAAELVDDVTRSAAALLAAWRAMPDDAWDRPTAMVGGVVPARTGPYARLSEVALHHVDLRSGYRPAEWAPAAVDVLLPRVVARLQDRAGDHPGVDVRRSDGEGRWRIGTGPAVATVDGRGAALAAWLAGRGWALGDGELAVEGDADVVRLLPERLPYG